MSAFKLSKDQEAKLNDIALRLSAAKDLVEDKFQGANDAISAFSKSLNDEITAYNVILAEAKAFTDGISLAAQEEFSDKSEAWQAGDKGQEVSAWMEEWSNIDLEPLDEVEVEGLDIPDLSHSGDLDNLGSEP